MLKLYNTMSRSIETFKPMNPDLVKIFTCGPSIYQRAHIGNYRTFLYEDILVRYLRFMDYKVVRAMNLTDIEDKTIKEAEKQKKDIKELTDEVLSIFHDGIDGLSLSMPEHLIPATGCIEQSVKMIQTLVDKGFAYEYKGDYFFDPLKVDNFGKLFKLDLTRWPKTKRRFKKDTYNGNRWNLGDFILWHNHKNDSGHPFWDTEIGKGRPSWNIQDPAVVTMSLGDQIDINCGGIDNIYRHHDYNIAVMEAYTGKNYSNFYLHGEHLIVNGITMSKSRGNILYPADVTASGEFDLRDLRFFLIHTHFRKKLNYTENAISESSSLLKEFRTTVNSINKNGSDNNEADILIEKIIPAFQDEADNNLSVGEGFNSVLKLLKQIKELSFKTSISELQFKKIDEKLKRIDSVLKVIYPLQ